MATHYISTVTVSIVVLLASLIITVVTTKETISLDVHLLEFSLNLEYLEAEFFLFGAFGNGLNGIAPELTDGGSPPIVAKVAKLRDNVTGEIIAQFGLQEVGHLRAIKSTVKRFSRLLLDLSKSSFAKLMDKAFGRPPHPPFDPYANDINFLLASYLIPYVRLTGYVGVNPLLQNPTSRQLVAGLLGVESGQDAVIRTLLYERRALKVKPYGQATSLLVRDEFSLSFPRTPEEILRIIYGSGHESVPGGFYPKGGNGLIARLYLHTT
ncbi:hypothetical protein TSUD_405080 [Trifolium subterraneum]|uniref:Desiccation-related protein PCC13-62 n=1 Tax=Trifolium subterraneum TaxID=3900 RepID=A0A2Z6PEZ5_TRISU|nr:hypothetical protein TSUD_405080 [Trifolium subterraneum]